MMSRKFGLKLALIAAVILMVTSSQSLAAKKIRSPQTSASTKPKFSGEKFYNVKTFTLDNGLDVYLVENHRTPVAGITVIYRVGSADDPRGKSGLAHFVEHMMFKGPKNSAPERIMRDAEAVGGSVNAMTNFDSTTYYEIVPKTHFEKFVGFEADRMRTLEVRQEDVTPEIKVVLEEENMRMGNNPFMQFMAAMRQTYFRHHPYGTMPIGYRNEIKSYTPKDVRDFYQNHYGPNNAFVILSGDVTLEEAKALMQKYFGDIPRRGGWSSKDRGRVIEPKLKHTAVIEKISDRVADPYVFIYASAPSVNQGDYTESDALSLGIFALTNQATGILHRRLVEEKKVASFVSIQYDPMTVNQDKLSIVTQSLEDVSLESLEHELEAALNEILQTGLSQKKLDQYKQELLIQGDYMKDSLLSGSDTLIAPLVANIPLERLEYWQSIVQTISVEDVNRALRTYLKPKYYVKGYLKPDPSKPQAKGGGSPKGIMNEAAHVH